MIKLKLTLLFVAIACFHKSHSQLWVHTDVNVGTAVTLPANNNTVESGIGYSLRFYRDVNQKFSTGILMGKKDYQINQTLSIDPIRYSITSILARARWNTLPNHKFNIYTEFGVGAAIMNFESGSDYTKLNLSYTIGTQLIFNKRFTTFLEFDWMIISDNEWQKYPSENNTDVAYGKKMNSRTFSVTIGMGFRIFELKK